MDLDSNLTHKAVRWHAPSFLNKLLNVLFFEQQRNILESWTCLDSIDPDFS